MNLKIVEARVIDKKIYVKYERFVPDTFVEDEKIFDSFKEFIDWLEEEWETGGKVSRK